MPQHSTAAQTGVTRWRCFKQAAVRAPQGFSLIERIIRSRSCLSVPQQLLFKHTNMPHTAKPLQLNTGLLLSHAPCDKNIWWRDDFSAKDDWLIKSNHLGLSFTTRSCLDWKKGKPRKQNIGLLLYRENFLLINCHIQWMSIRAS